MANNGTLRQIASFLRGMAFVLLAATWASAGRTQPDAPFRQMCEAFRPSRLASNEAVTKQEFRPASQERPAYCLIRGSLTTSPRSVIGYRIDLPDVGAWNGKLMMIGGGGFDGIIPTDEYPGVDIFAFRTNLVGFERPNLGSYILVGTDSGHKGRGRYPAFDMSWAAGNPDALANFADRANHLVLWSADKVATQFYGREPKRRYMIGASNGGRQGIVAAQRYPTDYHGIIALAPSLSQGRTAYLGTVLRHIFSRPENWLSPSALNLYTESEIAACDGLDGARDGVIGNYRACRFTGETLDCAQHASADPGVNCLTPGQIETIRLVRSRKSGAALPDGLSGYPGFGPGIPGSAWRNFLLGPNFETRDTIDYYLVDHGIKTLTDDPNENVMTFDPAKWRDSIAKSSDLLDPSPDLSAFFANGGKIIIWHGVGDPCVSFDRTGEFVDLVRRTSGASLVSKSLRFFVSPALDHYMEGPEANRIPFLALLETWVEKGTAPDRVIATRLDGAGKPVFTRPLCEYGKFPKYSGHGNPKMASSFYCAAS